MIMLTVTSKNQDFRKNLRFVFDLVTKYSYNYMIVKIVTEEYSINIIVNCKRSI